MSSIDIAAVLEALLKVIASAPRNRILTFVAVTVPVEGRAKRLSWTATITWCGVKNDHLGLEINYIYQGVLEKYRPDFIIRLANRRHLVLETKAETPHRYKTKPKFLDEWLQAVNAAGGFGTWDWAVSLNPADDPGILDEKMKQRLEGVLC